MSRTYRESRAFSAPAETVFVQFVNGDIFSALVGVVAFPSYHAAIALVPVRVTLPAKGDHDLTNGLAGVAITALACLWLAGRDRVAADTRRQ